MEVTAQILKTPDDIIKKELQWHCNLVLAFGTKSLLKQYNWYEHISSKCVDATVAICSTAGEIYDTTVLDNSVSIVGIKMKHTPIKSNGVQIQNYSGSFEAGVDLINGLPQHQLRYVLVLSDGSMVNGSELVKGMQSVLSPDIPITGGLAGDGADFKSTLLGLNEEPCEGRILAIGFYGEKIKVAHGTFGGWEPFGLERTISKSQGNVLFEIDDIKALDLYKRYLGKYAQDLPQSALLFPLAVKINDNGDYLVRTILTINEENESMTFAGDLPEGSRVRLMKANFDRLVDAAALAAHQTLTQFKDINPQWALLISCVGRKLVLANRIDEEVEAVRDALGEKVVLSGYYSYGEISPLRNGTGCELHNQTMTITCFEEI